MNILLVNSAAPELWGGGEKWFVNAALWFNANKHSATIVARPNSKLLDRADELKLETVPCKFGGDFDVLAMLRAREIIRASRAEVVLTNFNKESWQFGVAGRSQKIPVVARHGFTLWSKKLRHKLLAERVITHLIVNAESIRDYYASLGFTPKSIHYIPNGVSETAQNSGELRKQLGIDKDMLLLVAAGRLESQKRFDKLLNFAAALKKVRSFKLAIFGDGPHENDLRAQCKSLELEQYVSFRGFESNFAKLVGDADLFCLTSDEEGAPNAVLEAMIAGVPVLGFKVGSMGSMLSGELNSFLVEAGHDEQFQSRLIEITSDQSALASWRSKFKLRAQSEFSFELSMQRYLDILMSAAKPA